MDHPESDLDASSLSNQEEDDDIPHSDYDDLEDPESADQNGHLATRIKLEQMRGETDAPLHSIKQIHGSGNNHNNSNSSNNNNNNNSNNNNNNNSSNSLNVNSIEGKSDRNRLNPDMSSFAQLHQQLIHQQIAALAGLPATPWTPAMPPSSSSPGALPLAINPSVTTLSGSNAALAASNSTAAVASSSPASSGSSDRPNENGNGNSSLEAQKGYTFEEQFKQLYELSDDPKRKEFLDDLFTFMQKKGSPVNRIPIMAKHVLDLYELYRLVVARGGLVEVINKKIWREITKGLNLPSSITSAAFTLRTQYMKYLYPYECEKEGFSTPEELQAAIDGNRREGRRSSYGHYDMVGSTPPPPGVHRSHSNHHTSPISLVSRQANGHGSQGVSSGEEDNGSISSTPSRHNVLSTPAQEQALNLDVKGATGNGASSSSNHKSNRSADGVRDLLDHNTRAAIAEALASHKFMGDALSAPPAKRFLSEEDKFILNAGFPSASIKINSTNGRSESIVVSMDINGVTYQGMLHAQPSTHRNRLA